MQKPSKFPIDQNVAKAIYGRVGKKVTLFTAKLMEYAWGLPYILTHKLTSQRDEKSERKAADADEVDQIMGEWIFI